MSPGDTSKQFRSIEMTDIAWFETCFDGFEVGEPIQVQVTLPDGTVRVPKYNISRFSDRYQEVGFEWMVLPGEPLGTYVVAFIQGSHKATAAFTVRIALSPRLQVVPPSTGQPGATFRVVLAGFQPHERVAIFLYQMSKKEACPEDTHGWTGCYTYVTSLDPIQTDQNGEAIYDLHTQTNDLPNSYAIVPGFYFDIRDPNIIGRVYVYRRGIFTLRSVELWSSIGQDTRSQLTSFEDAGSESCATFDQHTPVCS